MTWPLVGRTAELDRVRGLLEARSAGVVLAGPAGVGKTRLAAECLSIAASLGFETLSVSATAGVASIPFGAFAPLMPSLGGTFDRGEVLRRIVGEIAGRGRGREVALLVDDAHLLDEASAALTHQLATFGRIRLVLTLRTGSPIPEPVTALWKDGILTRLDLRPLGEDDVAELLVAALGGPVDGGTLHSLVQRAEGNALYLRELVIGALEKGALVYDRVWRLTADLPPSPRLVEIISGRLGRLTPPEHRALVLLSLAEPASLGLMRTLAPDVELGALEQRAVVRLEESGRRLLVRFAHPLYSEVVRAGTTVLAARESARLLADIAETYGVRRREDVLRVGTWRLDGGGPMRPDLMLRAATTAREQHSLALAERLARAAFEAGAGFPAGVLVGQLCALQGRAAEAELHLASLTLVAADDSERAFLAATRMDVLFHGQRRPDLALEVADVAERMVTALEWRDQITAERARLLGRSGRYAEAVAVAKPILRRARGRALVSACFAAASSMSLTGELAGALDATARGHAAHLALDGPPFSLGPAFHLVLRTLALGIGGCVNEAVRLADEQYAEAVANGSIEARGWFAAQRAMAAIEAGRPQAATRYASEAVAVFRQIGWAWFTRWGLAQLAHGLALQGLGRAARSVCHEVSELGEPGGEFLAEEMLRARAWTEVAAGDLPSARSLLIRSAGMARESEAFAVEARVLHDLVRLGDSTPADRLEALTELVEGPMAAPRAQHARGVADQRPDLLEAASQTFEQLGAVLLAAEAAADAAVAWRLAGDVRRATTDDRRSRSLAGRCEGAVTPALSTTADARTRLTRRELEIARLAAVGLANKAIAERLFLSHRTVENTLHAAYAKLGVRARDALLEAIEPSSAGSPRRES